MLHIIFLTVKSVDEILKCEHSELKLRSSILSRGTVYYVVQGGSNVLVCG